MLLSYLFLAVMLFLVPLCVPVRAGERIHADYLSKENTLPIKGAFVFAVLLSHYSGYVSLPDTVLNKGFLLLVSGLGQLVVAVFFFYSGFGLYESVRTKGQAYVRGFLKTRAFPTWLRFAVCVFIYFLFSLAKNARYGVGRVLLAFVGWESIGNSNWFMCVTFLLYLAFFLSFSLFREKRLPKLICFTAITAALFLVFRFTRPTTWYNTIFCMAAGMWYGFFKDRIDAFLQRGRLRFWIAVGVLCVLFLGFYGFRLLNKFVPVPVLLLHGAGNLCAITFCLLIVALTMKITFRSWVCSFLGKHVFSIYILQRLFFAMFLPWIHNPYLFFVCAAPAAIGAAVLFDLAFDAFRKKIRY